MLKAIPQVRQIPGEARRSWFIDDDFDLIVWFDACDEMIGFQLIYDKLQQPHALTWKPSSGFQHDTVDDGESRPGRYKASPILQTDGAFQSTRVADHFRQAAAQLDQPWVDTIYHQLLSADI